METKDRLSIYLKELPAEEPSVNFTRLVMERVRVEARKAPVVYQPLITPPMWRWIFVSITLLLVGAILLTTYFPGSESAAGAFSLPKVDLSFLNRPFVMLTNVLNNISVNYLFILAGISSLLLLDQLYSRFAEH